MQIFVEIDKILRGIPILGKIYMFIIGLPTWVMIIVLILGAVVGVYLLVNHHREEEDIKGYVKKYVESWVKSINTYSFAPMAIFFEKGSHAYNEVKEEYKELTSAGAILELVKWEIKNGEAFSKAFYDSETHECTIRLYEEYNLIGKDGNKDNVATVNEYRARYLGTVEGDSSKRFKIISKRRNVG